MVEFFLSFYLQINIVRYLFVSGVRVITAWKTNCDLKGINFYQTAVFLNPYLRDKFSNRYFIGII